MEKAKYTAEIISNVTDSRIFIISTSLEKSFGKNRNTVRVYQWMYFRFTLN